MLTGNIITLLALPVKKRSGFFTCRDNSSGLRRGYCRNNHLILKKRYNTSGDTPPGRSMIIKLNVWLESFAKKCQTQARWKISQIRY